MRSTSQDAVLIRGIPTAHHSTVNRGTRDGDDDRWRANIVRHEIQIAAKKSPTLFAPYLSIYIYIYMSFLKVLKASIFQKY